MGNVEMDSQGEELIEQFVELLIEITALQRLYAEWIIADRQAADIETQLAMLERLLQRKLLLRQRKLARLREIYPEIEQFEWAKLGISDA